MAAATIFKFYFNGHNSVAIAHIRTILHIEAENEVLDVVLPSKCTSDKIQAVSYTHLTLPTNREV